MKTFKQHITEVRHALVKGWTKKNKIVSVSTDFSNYHIMQVTNKPRKFGLDEKKLLKILEDWFDDMSAPDPKQEAEDQLSELQSGGVIDNSPPIEAYLMKKGYCRFTIDKTHGSVEGQTEKECREGAKVLDDEYLPYERDGFKLFEIKPVTPFKPKYITSKFDWNDWLEGKKKRKHVSKMAQFRESVEYVIWGIPPKDKDETLLLTTGKDGKRITKKSDAMKLLTLLVTKHGVKKARIQELDVEVDPSDMFRNPFGEATTAYPVSYEKNTMLNKLVDKHNDPLKFVLDVITQMSKGKLKLRRIGVANTREVVAFWNSKKQRQIKPSYVMEMLSKLNEVENYFG